MLGNCSDWLVSCERCTGGKNRGNRVVGGKRGKPLLVVGKEGSVLGNCSHRLVGCEGCCRGNNCCRGD